MMLDINCQQFSCPYGDRPQFAESILELTAAASGTPATLVL